ncbi:MAG: hypothetical protein IPM18_05465 [Phycisphaerales bacterium]|nr:hypothetical protein [Phycisphaerales bacterium]
MMTLAGDMNCDGVVNFADLTLFIRAIKYFAGTETWPFDCPALNGDLNGDGTVTTADQSMFIAAITAGWTGPATAYDWDAENRLVRVRPVAGTEAAGMSRVDFGYDSAWRRVRKTVTPWDEQTSNWASAPSLDRKFLWSGWRMLLEIDVPAGGPEDVIRKFTWGLDLAGLNGAVNSLEQAGTIGGLLAVRKYDVSGAPEPDDPVDYVYLYDANGNVGQVVDWSHTASDPAGAVVAHYEYDPYGGVTKAEGAYASENAWRFSTKQWDDETGLGYWGYRYYSPALGRWVSRDPIEEEGGMNLYAYVGNRPGQLFDGLGLSSECACGVDVTRKLDKLLARLEWAFNALQPQQQYVLCHSKMLDPARGWDIHEFYAAGSGDSLALAGFRAGTCGAGQCEGTVTYRGGCYWTSELNYLLWGRMRRKCADSLNVKDPILRVAMGIHDINDDITLRGSISLMQGWRLTTIHRIAETECQYKRPGWLDPTVARERMIRAGWDWNLFLIESTRVSGCTPCRTKYSGTLWGHVGRLTLSITE